MRDHDRLERRVSQLEGRPACSSCKATVSLEAVNTRLETQNLQLRRMEDRVERHRDWADDRIEKSREVPIINHKMEKLSDQSAQTWTFMKSKWGWVLGFLAGIGLIGAVVTIIATLTSAIN